MLLLFLLHLYVYPSRRCYIVILYSVILRYISPNYTRDGLSDTFSPTLILIVIRIDCNESQTKRGNIMFFTSNNL